MVKVREIISNAVTLNALKVWMYITSNDFDNNLRMCLSAAVAEAETFTGLTLARSRYVITAPFANVVDPDIHPISAVESIEVDGSAISLEGVSIDGDVVTIPQNISGKTIELTLLAGADPIEPDIRGAILMIASAMLNSPTDSVENLPKASTHLLTPYKYFKV